VLIADLDARLDEFGRLVAACRQTLLAIENDPTYLVVRAAAPAGVTAQQAGHLLEGLPDTWNHLASVEAVLGETREALAHRNPSHAHQLLAGPSVMWTMRDGAMRQFTVNESLTALSDQLATARDRLIAIETAWTSTLPHLEADRKELDKLELIASELASGHMNELSALRLRVDGAITGMRNDPLGTQHVDRIDKDLARVRATLDDLRVRRDQLPARITAARNALQVIVATVERGREAHHESSTKLVDPVGLMPAVPEAAVTGPDGLAARLDRVSASSATSWRQRSTELDSWMVAADELLDRAKRVERANAEPIARRDELRGRLSAYHAKALAIGRIEDPQLVELFDTACKRLFATPADLRLAARAVLAYANAVNGDHS
jgi:hypothetical protein